jgi:hypothetical protein
LDLIKRHSNKEHDVILFYSGHGTEEGLQLDNETYLQPWEIEKHLDGFSGESIIYLSSCFSGDVRNYFENVKSNVTVVAASEAGSTLLANELGQGQAGFLALDLIGSKAILDPLQQQFKPRPKYRYFPNVCKPEETARD